MKGRFVVKAVLASLIFTACNKQDIRLSEPSVPPTQTIAQQEVHKNSLYSSGWETVASWEKESDAKTFQFSYKRNTPQLKKEIVEKGVVVVFVRNIWGNDPLAEEMGEDKPLMLPFNFLPYFEQPNYTEEWSYTADEEQIHLSLSVDGATKEANPNRQVQFRYVIIPHEILQQKGQTAEGVRNMSYDEIMNLFSLQI